MTAANGGNDHFFKKDTPHGLVKRFMWKKHVQTFIAMTQRSDNFDTTIIFDGFAGAGRYGSEDEWPDEIEKYASPLISLRAAIDFHVMIFRKNNITQQDRYDFIPDRVSSDLPTNIDHGFPDEKIQLHFVEKKKGNYQKLTINVLSLFIKYGIQVAISEHENEMYVSSSDENIPV